MTSNASPLPSSSLAAEKLATTRLIETLKQEQELLSGNGEADQIPDVISEKATIVAEMASLADSRHRILNALGLPASEDGMQLWVDQQGNESDKELWNALFDLAQTARELNRLNGLLVGRQLAINQGAMNVLQGKSNGNFYGPDGQSSMRTSGRPLAVG
jgi:flagellar biosynthesis protein FlgN